MIGLRAGEFAARRAARGTVGWACDGMFALLDRAEMRIVERTAAFAARRRLVTLARVTTRLGDGWLYPGLSLLLLLSGAIEAPARFLASAALSILLVFSGYPFLKGFLSRKRPCDRHPALSPAVPPLDRYSFPSGHTMMAAAFSGTLLAASPESAPLAALVTGGIGWSRIALGHHYLSDVIAGAFLGGGVASCVAILLF